MKIFKTYNLKLSKEGYFKLREIEMKLEKTKEKSLTKSEVLAEIIEEYEM